MYSMNPGILHEAAATAYVCLDRRHATGDLLLDHQDHRKRMVSRGRIAYGGRTAFGLCVDFCGHFAARARDSRVPFLRANGLRLFALIVCSAGLRWLASTAGRL